MVYKIQTLETKDYGNGTYGTIVLTFTDAEEANKYIHNVLETVCYSVVGVKDISDEVIELYCDVV